VVHVRDAGKLRIENPADERLFVLKMVVEGLPVQFAGVHDMLHADFIQRHMFDQFFQRLRDQLLCQLGLRHNDTPPPGENRFGEKLTQIIESVEKPDKLPVLLFLNYFTPRYYICKGENPAAGCGIHISWP
jgi:hypothetical protein